MERGRQRGRGGKEGGRRRTEGRGDRDRERKRVLDEISGKKFPKERHV